MKKKKVAAPTGKSDEEFKKVVAGIEMKFKQLVEVDKAIEVVKLKKYYGKVRGAEDVSFSLEKGEVFGFIGPNGAGKSTTIRCIMNLINKNDGQIFVKGKEYNSDDVELKKIIGYLPSEVFLYDDLTVKEMLDYHEKFHGIWTHEKRVRMVELLEIDESKKIEDLSLGNKKKVGVVLALAHNPEIIILDEPTSGLDPIMQQTFYNLIKEEKKQGKTIIYSTHILDEVSKICDTVGFIKDGRLIKVDSVDGLTKDSFSKVTITSLENDKILKELSSELISAEENTMKIKTEMSADDLIKTLAKYRVEKVLIEEPTIEELFMHYYE